MTTEPESPYLSDGRQWAWNSTALGLAKECKRKYYLAQLLGKSTQGENVHLTFGRHYAKALEDYHRLMAAGLGHAESVANAVHALLSASAGWESEHNFKNRDTLLRSVIWYLEEYKDDPCKTVVLEDGRPAVELPCKFQVDDEIMLVCHLDRIVQYSEDFYIQDQKTTGATLGAYYFQRFNPDNQMSCYTICGEVVWKTPVKGVMIDAAQIAVGFTRFARGFTHRTSEQSKEWLRTAIYHIKQTWNCYADNFWPMNDKACQLYGGCPFLGVCDKDPRVQEDFLRKYDISINNPLAER